MLAVESHHAGALQGPEDFDDDTPSLQIQPFGTSDQSSIPIDSPAIGPAKSPFEYLQALFENLLAEATEAGPAMECEAYFWEAFHDIASDMAQQATALPGRHSLCHLDLAPRNIIIDTAAEDGSPMIRAVLDWDSAVMAPKFMGCSPPLWLWGFDDDIEFDDDKACVQPETEPLREQKRAFDEAAGSEYTQMAYQPQYRLARRLMRLAMLGFHTTEDFTSAEAIIKEYGARNDVGAPRIEMEMSEGADLETMSELSEVSEDEAVAPQGRELIGQKQMADDLEEP